MPDCGEAAAALTASPSSPPTLSIGVRALPTGQERRLVVIADDYGIGPATSRAILELAREGRITGAALLVNSPFAADAVRAWRRAGEPMELGWHVCLTLDRPVLPAGQVPSLVRPDGRFWPLRRFLGRWILGQLDAADLVRELRAQFDRFVELTESTPSLVNSHQHIQLFAPVGTFLLDPMRGCRPLPYLRRVREPWLVLAGIPGARLKRSFLTWLGRRQAGREFPGNEWLAGVTNPKCVEDPAFLTRWLTRIPGNVVELMCHPGYRDDTLLGRDCATRDGLRRRVRELHLLRDAAFARACQDAGFRHAAPSEVIHGP